MEKRLKTVAILALAGIPGYIFCFLSHVCWCGHMQHGPYPAYHYLIDLFWATCFAAVFTFSIKLKAKRKRVFFYGSLLLMTIRIPLQGLGGGDFFIWLPVIILFVLYAVRYLKNPDKYITNANHLVDFTRKNADGQVDV